MTREDSGAMDALGILTDWVLPWPRVAPNWSRSALLVIDVQNYSSNPTAGITERLVAERSPFAAYDVERLTTVMIPILLPPLCLPGSRSRSSTRGTDHFFRTAVTSSSGAGRETYRLFLRREGRPYRRWVAMNTRSSTTWSRRPASWSSIRIPLAPSMGPASTRF